MNYVYVLYSLKDEKFYIGRPFDLCRRIERHNKGWVKSTKNRRPLKLIHCEVFEKAKEAFLREKELKALSSGKFKKELRNKLGL